MNYIIEFSKEIIIKNVKNDGEAMAKAIDELEKLLVRNQVQGTFDIYAEEY